MVLYRNRFPTLITPCFKTDYMYSTHVYLFTLDTTPSTRVYSYFYFQLLYHFFPFLFVRSNLTLYFPQKPKARGPALIAVLPSLARGEGWGCMSFVMEDAKGIP
jgi:hypothetical protein